MKKRIYSSPLRADQAAATRERILAGVVAVLGREDEVEVSFRAVAAAAGVQERTIYRYFPDKESLLRAFWHWLDLRLGHRGMPSAEEDILRDVKIVFAKFDEQAPLIRAALLSREGRAMRMSVQSERVAGFTKALKQATANATPTQRRHAAAVIQLLYSGYAWMSMADHWGLNGAEAGEASAWAIGELLTSLKRGGRERKH